MADTIDCSDPAALARDAACYCYDDKTAIAVELYLLARLAGGTMDPTVLAREAAAAGFTGISNKQSQDAVRLYLLCNAATAAGA